MNIDKIKDISDRPALMDIAGDGKHIPPTDDKIRKGGQFKLIKFMMYVLPFK